MSADNLASKVDSNENKEDDVEQRGQSKEDSLEKDNEKDDPWGMTAPEEVSVPWKDLTTGGKAKRVLWNYIFRPICLLFLIYMFFCALDFLSSAFRLLGGTAAGEVFSNNEVFSNPIAGLMIGVLVTVLVQSSSTSSSIVVSMVGSNLLKVETAIYIIMGANVGTSVTSTIVSFGQSGDRNQFRRAFAGAAVHGMFNWLCVAVLLPLEYATGSLDKLSNITVKSFHMVTNKGSDVKFLKAITEPFTHYIVKVDMDVLEKIVRNETDPDTSLIKTDCGKDNITEPCKFMFMNVAGVWDDWVIGLILFCITLFILIMCLVFIVKILNTIFSGQVALYLKKYINSDFPGWGKYFTAYAVMVIGAVLTIVLNSSSVLTSALTPLVGVGVVSIERMYPLCLGANIGTTFTSILASLAQDGDTIEASMQVSMVHLYFNVFGILLWYPLPFMRKLPIFLAKRLGDITAKYRWFAILFTAIMFLGLPGGIFGLSAISPWVLAGVLIPVGVLVIVVVIINVLQTKRPNSLPKRLRTWDFLPLCCHSLKPLDRIISKVFSVCTCCKKDNAEEETSTDVGETNKDVENDDAVSKL